MAWKTEATVSHLSDTLKDTAGKSLPEKCYKKPHKWKDATVSALCAQSKAARHTWKENGCPKEVILITCQNPYAARINAS